MSQQRIVVLLSLVFFAASAAFGAYVYRQFEAYFQDTISAYNTISGPVSRAPKLSRGVSESGKLIRIYYPNRGMRLGIGDPYTIFWEYKGTGDFAISLVNADPVISPKDIVRVLYGRRMPTNDFDRGIYSWKVGSLADGSVVGPSTGWKIVVADGGEPDAVFDESDHYFAIVK